MSLLELVKVIVISLAAAGTFFVVMGIIYLLAHIFEGRE